MLASFNQYVSGFPQVLVFLVKRMMDWHKILKKPVNDIAFKTDSSTKFMTLAFLRETVVGKQTVKTEIVRNRIEFDFEFETGTGENRACINPQP